MAQTSILIQVIPGVGGAPDTLQYTATTGAVVIVGSKQKMQKGGDVEWKCNDGDFAVQFTTTPFTTLETALSAVNGVSTGFKKTKNQKKKYKYFAAVARPGRNPPVLTEDPELEVTDNPGGGPRKHPAKAAT